MPGALLCLAPLGTHCLEAPCPHITRGCRHETQNCEPRDSAASALSAVMAPPPLQQLFLTTGLCSVPNSPAAGMSEGRGVDRMAGVWTTRQSCGSHGRAVDRMAGLWTARQGCGPHGRGVDHMAQSHPGESRNQALQQAPAQPFIHLTRPIEDSTWFLLSLKPHCVSQSPTAPPAPAPQTRSQCGTAGSSELEAVKWANVSNLPHLILTGRQPEEGREAEL